MAVMVKDFSVSLYDYEKLLYILDLVNQDYGIESENEDFLALIKTLSKYFDINEFINGNIKEREEWLFEQLKKSLKKDEILCGDIQRIYEEVKPILFRYVVSSLVKNGVFDCLSISAYKKICKLLITEEAFEFLEQYCEGLRICRGKLKEEFLKKVAES